jgi:hypothetical protein
MDNFSFSVKIDGVDTIITSVAEANKKIRELTKQFVDLTVAGKDASQTLATLNKTLEIKNNLISVQSGFVNLNKSINTSQTASANAAQALLNLNYVVRDSPYFFNNFALGVMAVGNNINPLIDSFTRLRMEAGEKAVSAFTLLKQALVGGAGISIAFSVLVSAIQAFVFWQSHAKEKTEDLTKAIDEQKKSLEQLSDRQIRNMTVEYDIKVSEMLAEARAKMKREQDLYQEKIKQSRYNFQLTAPSENIEDYLSGKQKEQLAQYREMIQYLRMYLMTRGDIERKEAEILDLLQKQKQVIANPELVKAYEDRIKKIREEIDALKGKLPKEPKEPKEKTVKTVGAEVIDELYSNIDREIRSEYEKQIAKFEAIGLQFDPVQKLFVFQYAIEIVEKRRKLEGMQMRANELPFVGGRELPEDVKKRLEGYKERDALEAMDEAKRKEMALAQASNIVGDSLMSAFNKGRFALDEFIQSLTLAIAKMFILQGIAYLFGQPSLFGNVTKAGAAGAVSGGMPKINVNVGGSMKMNGREFVVQFKRIENSMNRVLVG